MPLINRNLDNFWGTKYKPKAQQTVYIVPDNVSKIQYTDIWRDAIPRYLEELGFIVKTLEVKMYSHMFGPAGDLYYRSQQMELLSSMMVTNSIRNGDIFIFHSIWNPLVIALEQYRRTTSKKSIITIGFWREDTISAITEKMRYSWTDNPVIEYRRKEWAIHLSFGFFKTCDFVIFDDKKQMEQIWWSKAFKKAEWGKLKDWQGYPLSIAKKYIEYPIEKENVIVIPYAVTTHNEKFYLDRLKEDFQDCEIVELYDGINCTREVYTYHLRRAKVIINLSKVQQHFKNLYEPFLYRTHVFTHDKIRPQGIMPDEYLFSKKLFQHTIPLMVFRNWVPLSARIRDVIDNYDKHLPTIEQHEQILTDNWFPADDFCKILETVKYKHVI